MFRAARRARASLGPAVTLWAALVVLLLAFAWSPAGADPQTVAPADPKFNGGRPLQLGGARIVFSSPTLADLDGDRKPDIVVGGSDGIVYAIRSTGEVLWTYQVAKAINPLVSHPTQSSVIRGAISVADINADGYPEVVVPVGEIDEREVNGAVVVLDRRGAILPGWPVITRDHWGENANGYSDGVAASPALGDLDGDGDLEIVVMTFDQQFNAWHHDGTRVRGWPKFVHEGQWSPVGLADMDNDGTPEIVALVTTQQEPSFDTVQGGDLRIYRPDGRLVCRYTIDQAFTSAPAIGDLDGDGTLEIVSGTGDWYAGAGRGWNVYAWDRNCKLRPGWPVKTNSYMTSAPALADLDGDGKLEVISSSGTIHQSSFDPRIYAWRHDGSVVPGFPATPITSQGNTSYPLSPIIADWNADGRAEILTSLAWEVGAVRGNGTQYTYWPGGPSGGKTFWARYTLNNTPAVGDIDGDGRLELVVASVFVEGNPATAGIFVYESPSANGRVAWPMLGANARHDHVYPRTEVDDAVIARRTVPAVMVPGEEYDTIIEVRNTGTSTWTAGAGYYLKGVKSDDKLRTAEVAALESGQSIQPGGVARFEVTLRAPQMPGYYRTEWRMSRGDKRFGLEVAVDVKVGNDPALYVLAKDATRNPDTTGIYPGGLASRIPAPNDAGLWRDNQLWQRATAFDVLPDGSGYHVATQEGYTTWSAGTPELGRLPARPNSRWIGLRLTPAGIGLFGLSQDGEIRFTEGTELLSGVPLGPERGLAMLPGVPAGQVVDLDVTANGKGIAVLDRRGRVYAFGSAAALPLPAGLPFPDGEPIAKRIKLTSSGKGYYLLDAYGRVWRTGDAPALEAHYNLHMGEDWARDLELTEDGRGYYLLDKYGRIYRGGIAAPVTVNVPPVWESDQAVDLVLLDDRRAGDTTIEVAVPGGAVSLLGGLNRMPAPTRIVIGSSNGAPLSWTAKANDDWVKLSSMSGQTPGTLEISLARQLPVGEYHSNLHIEAKNSTGGVVDATDVALSVRVVRVPLHSPLADSRGQIVQSPGCVSSL